ncbi:MAG: hypothetical protein ACW967_01025 [Candidatus Hodarchaeales archaeon]|jgi:hypothetical protein
MRLNLILMNLVWLIISFGIIIAFVNLLALINLGEGINESYIIVFTQLGIIWIMLTVITNIYAYRYQIEVLKLNKR